ncbi:MAG: hypothetical protein WBM12_04735, partial [Pseudolabrys sp.]
LRTRLRECSQHRSTKFSAREFGHVRFTPESNYQWTAAPDHPMEWGFLRHPLPRQKPWEATGKRP